MLNKYSKNKHLTMLIKVCASKIVYSQKLFIKLII